MSKSEKQSDPRIHVSYQSLIHLQGQANAFSLLPNFKAGSVLSGRHGSQFRGRGLNFEELRNYQLGDDIRNLDWKVTMRTGKPHVRTYTEEKDHNVILCVDQRSSMFFSSVHTMKSVIAAELSALTAWRVLKDNDRVGFLIFDDNDLHWHKPGRSQKELLYYLSVLTEVNQGLSVGNESTNQVSFSKMVEQLIKLKMKDTVIVIYSDWDRATEQDLTGLQHLQRHNDVLGILIRDPMENRFDTEKQGDWVISDGTYQLNITGKQGAEKAHAGLEKDYQMKKENLRQLMAVKHLPLIEIGTGENYIADYKRAFGGSK